MEGMLSATDRLFVPHRKRLSQSYLTNAEGARELRIDYGIKEVTFDEAHLFPFGERIVRETSFTGAEAVTWGPGYRWEELRPLLEVLIEEGIIKRGGRGDDRDAAGDDRLDGRGGGLAPSLLPPSVCPAHRMWSAAECEALSAELGGRPVELGHLEAVVPLYRIAHPALDGDHRQIGEGNVFPPRLRLDLETEWRVCQYSGSRYRDRAPMNVTGLRAMIKHWKPMMKTLLGIRAAVRERFGPAAQWTIGELHLLACAVLGFPTYGLMKGGGTSPQRPIHPVLSSLFRITDGIRMTTFEMLFSVEHARRGDEPLSAVQLHEHAEMNALLIGATGVCAGPRPLIDEFLATAVDGAPAEGIEHLELPAEIDALLAELPAAIDYAFLGMMAWGTSLSIWLEMSRAYQAIRAMLAETAASAGLREHLDRDWRMLEQLQLTRDPDRDVHWRAYLDAYERSRRGLRRPVGAARLAEAVALPPETVAHRTAAKKLRVILERRRTGGELAGSLAAAAVEPLAELLVLLLRHEQATLAATAVSLEQINAILDRPRPRRPLEVRDFLSFYGIAVGHGVFPYLFDTLEAELGLHVAATTTTLTISDRRAT